MTATVVGTASRSRTFDELVAIPLPAGAVPGDVWYAAFQMNSTTATITDLQGFTLEATLKPTGGTTTLFVLAKVVTQADVDLGLRALALSAAGTALVVAIAFNAAHPTYKDGAATTVVTGSQSTMTCTAVTTSENNELLLMIGCADANSRTVSSWTAPLATQVQLGDTRRLALATGLQAAAGSSGSKVLTLSGSDRNAAYLVAIANMPNRLPPRSSARQLIAARPIHHLGV